MKRTFALLLCLAMLASAPVALAGEMRITEGASTFDLTVAVPADAVVSEDTHDNVPYTFITFEDATKPHFFISVAPNEIYDADSVASLSEADQESLVSDVSTEMEDPAYSLHKTKAGYDYLLVEDNAAIDSAVLVLLKDGYLIQMSVWHEDYATLTAQDNTLATDLIDTLKIVKN